MFYSRELLARKASLGQIWLLGTRQSKLDRRKTIKLDVAKLCDEILNPPVPMALRLTSILMGGVVILYEKKVTLLHDDANRLVVDLRNAWKEMRDPTLLPKRKVRARRKSVTLPENEDTSIGEPDYEELTERFQQHNLNMRLDQVDDYYTTIDPMENKYQAADINITLSDSYQPNTVIHNQFERFEDDGDTTLLNSILEEHTKKPTSHTPPARQYASETAEEIQEQHPENKFNQQFNETMEARDQQRQGPVKRKVKKAKGITQFDEEVTIPNYVYHSWLDDTSDIVSRRGKKRGRRNILSTSNLVKFMELPTTIMLDDQFVKGNHEIPYAAPLLELCKKSIQPHGDPPVRTSQPQPPEPFHPHGEQFDYPMDYPLETQRMDMENKFTPSRSSQYFSTLNSGGDSSSHAVDMRNKDTSLESNQYFTPTGDAVGYTGSSVSGDGVPSDNLELNIGRAGSKKNNVPSTSRNSGNLDPVVEVFHEADADYKLTRAQQTYPTPDQELLAETQISIEAPANNTPDQMTENIRKHMKAHFETPGAPQVESLNNLAGGMNRKGAAQLFYQTCVLASQDFLKVEQKQPFGDIFISKGRKM